MRRRTNKTRTRAANKTRQRKRTPLTAKWSNTGLKLATRILVSDASLRALELSNHFYVVVISVTKRLDQDLDNYFAKQSDSAQPDAAVAVSNSN